MRFPYSSLLFTFIQMLVGFFLPPSLSPPPTSWACNTNFSAFKKDSFLNERLPFNALVLLRKEKEKMRETARPRLKKISVRQQHANWLFWLPQTNLQTAFELQQNRSLYYDVAKNRPRWNHQQGFPAKSNASYEGYFNICPWFLRWGILNFSSASFWHFYKAFGEFQNSHFVPGTMFFSRAFLYHLFSQVCWGIIGDNGMSFWHQKGEQEHQWRVERFTDFQKFF